MTSEERQQLRSLIDRASRDRLRGEVRHGASVDGGLRHRRRPGPAGYRRGCRCDGCVEAHRLANRQWRAKVRA